jgi:hypothetical protein
MYRYVEGGGCRACCLADRSGRTQKWEVWWVGHAPCCLLDWSGRAPNFGRFGGFFLLLESKQLRVDRFFLLTVIHRFLFIRVQHAEVRICVSGTLVPRYLTLGTPNQPVKHVGARPPQSIKQIGAHPLQTIKQFGANALKLIIQPCALQSIFDHWHTFLPVKQCAQNLEWNYLGNAQ